MRLKNKQLNDASRASRLGFSKRGGVGAGLQTSRGFYILIFNLHFYVHAHFLCLQMYSTNGCGRSISEPLKNTPIKKLDQVAYSLLMAEAAIQIWVYTFGRLKL